MDQPEPLSPIELGARLRAARKRCDMTLQEVGARLNISTATLSIVECGKSVNQQAKYIPLLAKVYGAEPSEFGYAEEPPSSRNRLSRTELGARARARRELMRLSCSAVAKQLGISDVTIYQSESCLPRKRRPHEDAWERVLLVPPGWLRNADIESPMAREFPESRRIESRSAMDDIRDICTWYSRKSLIFRSTDLDELDESEHRMASIMFQRYGFLGEDATVLEAIGERHGITRERVRQIEEDFMSRLDGATLPTPGINRLFALALPSLPLAVHEFDVHFAQHLGTGQSVVSVDKFCRVILGKSFVRVAGPVVPIRTNHVVLPLDMPDDDVIRVVRGVALAQIRVLGAAQVHLVAGISTENLGREVTTETTLRVCRIYEKFEWLVSDDGWFWFGPDNARRVRGTLMKLFSVSNRPLDIEEIHQAIARARLVRYEDGEKRGRRVVEVPMRVLQEAVSRCPGVSSVRYDDFRYCDVLDPKEHLAESELAIYTAILNHQGVIGQQDLIVALDVSGESAITAVAMALERSPIFLRIEPGIWTIRGVRFSGAAYDLAVQRWGGGRRSMISIVTDGDGWRRFRFSIPPSIFTQSNWILPTDAVRWLSNGIYTVEAGGEAMEFRRWDDRGGFLRYRHVFARCGIGPGDVVQLEVQESNRTLRVEKILNSERPSAI